MVKGRALARPSERSERFEPVVRTGIPDTVVAATRCWKAENSGVAFCPHGFWISPVCLATAPTFMGTASNGSVPHGSGNVAQSVDAALTFPGCWHVVAPVVMVADQSIEWLLLSDTSMCTPIIRPNESNVWLRGGL